MYVHIYRCYVLKKKMGYWGMTYSFCGIVLSGLNVFIIFPSDILVYYTYNVSGFFKYNNIMVKLYKI